VEEKRWRATQYPPDRVR